MRVGVTRVYTQRHPRPGRFDRGRVSGESSARLTVAREASDVTMVSRWHAMARATRWQPDTSTGTGTRRAQLASRSPLSAPLCVHKSTGSIERLTNPASRTCIAPAPHPNSMRSHTEACSRPTSGRQTEWEATPEPPRQQQLTCWAKMKRVQWGPARSPPRGRGLAGRS